MRGTFLDCGCYVNEHGHRTLCPTCADLDRPRAPASDPEREAARALLAAAKGIETVYAEYMALRPDPLKPGFDLVTEAVSKARTAIAKAEPQP